MNGKSVHFIGIGGAGMSALARYFLSQNWDVSGSDLAESPITAELRKEGVKVKIGQKKSNIRAGMALAVYSQAIRPDNPELKEARRYGIQTLSYPEEIGELTRQYKTITVSGAHGKSTTTALSALILEKGGFDPTVIVGANLKEFGGKNFRKGKCSPSELLSISRKSSDGEYLVLEADEFGRAFLHYSPACAIITNIDREHLDTYKNLADIKKTFLRFLANIRDGGTAIINRDDKNCHSLKEKIAALARRKNLKVIWYSLRDSAAKKIKEIIQIPGEHNVSNSLAAYYLGQSLEIPEKNILAAIGAYRGASRRMEYRGELKATLLCHPREGEDSRFKNLKVSVYDDYAHHPAEIKATLRAFREKFPKAKIICMFQPHQARRLAALFKEFKNAFDSADSTIILPLYKVPGRDEESILDSEALVRAIQKRRPKRQVFYLNDPKKLKDALNPLLACSGMKNYCCLRNPSKFEAELKTKNKRHKQIILVMMGAGNIVQYTDELLKEKNNYIFADTAY